MTEKQKEPETTKTYDNYIDEALAIAKTAGPLPITEADLLDRTVQASRHLVIDVPSSASETFQIPVSHEAPATRETNPRVKRNRANLAATAAVVATVAGVGGVAYSANSEPDFSKETTTFTVQQGDGIFDAAQEIKGLNNMNDGIEHIKNDPANIDVLKDGLQPGEQLEIPVSVAGHENDVVSEVLDVAP